MNRNAASKHRAAFVNAMRKNRRGSSAQGKKLARYSKMVAKYRRAGRNKTQAKRLAHKKVFGKNRRGSYEENRRRSRKRKGRKSYRANRRLGKNRKSSDAERAARSDIKAANQRLRDMVRAAHKAERDAKKIAASEKRKASAARRAAEKEARKHKRAASASKKGRKSAKRKFRRASVRDPISGRARKSYMYRDKKGRLRKIPTWVLAGEGGPKGALNQKGRDAIMKRRRAAAARLLKQGSAFVPNRSKRTTMNENKKGRRRKKMTKKQRRARSRRFMKLVSKYRKRGKSKRKAYSLARKKMGIGKKNKRRGKRRGKRRSRGKGGKSRRRGKGRRKARRNARGSYEENRRSRKRGKRRGKRRMRRNYRRNQFMSSLKNVLKTGALVAVGFIVHRSLTSLIDTYGFSMLTKPKEGEAQSPMQSTLSAWGKPIVGLAVGLAGIAVISKAVKNADTAKALGGGMVASWVQNFVVTALLALNQPAVAGALAGVGGGVGRYRRRNRRGMRGMGQAWTGIGPRYTPVGEYEQAAAGMGQYMQAAAGTGDYFTPSATGEYFLPPSQVKGVGFYEQAGPLAMQGRATGQIDDGIRPDADLDKVMTLSEAAAGVGMGEFYTGEQRNGDWYDTTVGTQSQWIPNGPLWAGELKVADTQGESDLPAGVLAGPGGNGVLSG